MQTTSRADPPEPAKEWLSAWLDFPDDVSRLPDFSLMKLEFVVNVCRQNGIPDRATVNWGGGQIRANWSRSLG